MLSLAFSTMFNSTTFSSSRRKLQRANPTGAGEQVRAINFASAAPSKIRGRAEFGLYLRVSAAAVGINAEFIILLQACSWYVAIPKKKTANDTLSFIILTSLSLPTVAPQLSPHFFEGQNATGGWRFAATILV